MDPLNDNIVALLQASADPFTREIWKDGRFNSFILKPDLEAQFLNHVSHNQLFYNLN